MHFWNKSLVFSTGIQFYFSHYTIKLEFLVYTVVSFLFISYDDRFSRFSRKQIMLPNRNVLKILFFSVKTGSVFLLQEKPIGGMSSWIV